MAARVCAEDGCPQLVRGARRCPTHQREYEVGRGTPTLRGYGREHRLLRADWQARIDAGQSVACTRCGLPIHPGDPWDLGHTDDRSTWSGPEHQRCNRSDGGKRGAAITNSTYF